MLLVPLHAGETLAAAELHDADLRIASVLDYFHFHGSPLYERSAKGHALVTADHEDVLERDFLLCIAFQQRHREGVAFLDDFLEACDGNDCEHGKCGECKEEGMGAQAFLEGLGGPKSQIMQCGAYVSKKEFGRNAYERPVLPVREGFISRLSAGI